MAAFAVTVASPGITYAVSSDAVIDQAEQQRQEIRQRQAELAAQLDVSKAKSEELIAALTTLDQQVQAQTAKATEAKRAFEDADRRFAELQTALNENQTEVDNVNNELRQQAVRRYLKPEENDSSVRLLKATDIDEAQQRKVLSDAVAGSSRDLIERLRGARARIVDVRQHAADARKEADDKRTEHNKLLEQLLLEVEAHKRVQTEWDRRVAELKAGSDELNASAAEVDKTIADRQKLVQAPAAPVNAAPAPAVSNGRFIWPTASHQINQAYGNNGHPGMDIGAPLGATVWAGMPGKVSRANTGGGYNGGYGNLVVIDHPNGLQSYYAHLNVVSVSVGASVSQGQTIGTVGMTGNTTGPHLHLEMYLNKVRQNPANYLT